MCRPFHAHRPPRVEAISISDMISDNSTIPDRIDPIDEVPQRCYAEYSEDLKKGLERSQDNRFRVFASRACYNFFNQVVTPSLLESIIALEKIALLFSYSERAIYSADITIHSFRNY